MAAASRRAMRTWTVGASFKKIRDGGYWNQLETCIREPSEADSTHGTCPGCVRALCARAGPPPGPPEAARGPAPTPFDPCRADLA